MRYRFGGPVRQITRVEHGGTDAWYAWPQFLPDSRRFLYQIVAIDGSSAGVFAGSLDSPESVRLLDASAATFAPPGYLLYVQHGMLMAEALDLERMTLGGRPVLLARGLSAPSLAEGNVVSGSRELLAFREGTTRQPLMQVDRSGTQRGGAIETPVALSNVRLSPDGGSLLATGSVTDAPGVWLVDLVRQQQTRLSADGLGSVWSPDGRRIAFTTRGGRDLFVRSARDGNDARIVATDSFVKVVNDWSPDGRQMIYAQIDAETKLDLWAIPASGGTPTPLLKTPFNEAQARISPDGRWIAYVTEQSGTAEVWVRRYPQMDEPRQVSVGGGGQPQWRPDQSELFYLSPDHTLMAVVTPGAERPSFGTPQRLFQTSIAGGPSDARDSYAVMSDGATFLVYGTRDTAGPAPITVIRNWAAGLTPVAVAPAREPRSAGAASQSAELCGIRFRGASRLYFGAQNGSPALTSWTGTSVTKLPIQCAMSSMPASSETAWPSMIQPFGMPSAAASSTYSGLSSPPSTSCCSPLITTSTSAFTGGVA